MSAIASLHDAEHEVFWHIEIVVHSLIEAGADVNVVDKVSYHHAPCYNN